MFEEFGDRRPVLDNPGPGDIVVAALVGVLL